MSKRGVNLYLEDIKDSIRWIEKYVTGLSFDDFKKDRRTVDAVVRNLEIIGEAVSNIPEEIKRENPHVPWGEIIGMRNKIIHEYFGVDVEILWKTAKEDIPELKKGIGRLKF